MDAANDTIEMVVIVFTLCLTPLFHQPISEKRPFGYAQVETVFTAAKALMMLSVMLGLGINVIQTILSGGSSVDYPSVSLFQFLLGIISLIILIAMYRTNRSISSPTVRAELIGWRLDAAYSMGLAFAFFLAQLLKNTRLGWLSPYFDQIGALIVVALVLPEGIRLLRESVRDIFLFSPGEEQSLQIKKVSAPILAKFSLCPVFYDITQTGRRTWVSIYFDSAEDTLHVSSLRQATEELQKELCTLIENCSCELILAPQKETSTECSYTTENK